MKKREILIPLMILAVLAVVLFGLAVWIRSIRTPNAPAPGKTQTNTVQEYVYFTSNPAASQENEENASSAPANPGYFLQEYRGRIGVFREGETVPFQEIDVLIESLPPSDRALLAKGIFAADETALRSLLEDYSS